MHTILLYQVIFYNLITNSLYLGNNDESKSLSNNNQKINVFEKTLAILNTICEIIIYLLFFLMYYFVCVINLSIILFITIYIFKILIHYFNEFIIILFIHFILKKLC